MKYIRTKDGIYEVVKEDDEWIDVISNFERKMKCQCCIKKKSIINQSDTIEELCDGFIITSKQGHIYDSYGDYGYELKEVLPQAKEECPYEDWDLYGCILVNGIIKQVAKMNEKGELELL